MRTIKFRAWDNQDNKMVSVRSINFKGHPFHENSIVTSDNIIIWLDRTNLMQFTGLLDKNGKEIYEGDILQWIGLTFPITVDSFHGYRFMFGKDQICKAFAIDGEIIGNIYETPELLK